MLSDLEHRLIAINIQNNDQKLSKKFDNVVFRLNATLYRINIINKIIKLLETTPTYLDHINQNVCENTYFIKDRTKKSFSKKQKITHNNVFENFSATHELDYEYNDFFTNATSFIDCLIDILFHAYITKNKNTNEYFYDFTNFIKNKNNIKENLPEIYYNKIMDASRNMEKLLIERRHDSVHKYANRLNLSINYKQIEKIEDGISSREDNIEITTDEMPQETIEKITKIIENIADEIINALKDKIMPHP